MSTTDPLVESKAEVPDEAPPVKKREIFGWAMYDFANSSYTTVVISVIYSAFFVQHIVPEGSDVRDGYWSMAIIASTILAIILSPLVGAICDYTGRKKRYLGYSTIVCAISTAALFFVEPGQIWIAIGLLTISNAAFMIGESFCASFLTDLATKENMGKISGLGWGFGYFGGLLSLVAIIGTITADPESAFATYVRQNQWGMVIIGVFYAITALPTFLLVRERARPAPGFEQAGIGELMRAGFGEMAASFQLAKKYDVLFKFFLAFTVYMAGLEVIIKFVGIYATAELALDQTNLTIMFLIIQLSAAAGALGFGVLETRIGAKSTVLLTIVWWCVGILGIFFLEQIAALLATQVTYVFFGVALMAGAGLGSIQSSSRTVVGLLSPEGRSAQMFGFWGMFSRLAIILGMSFGFVSDMVGRRYGILLVLVFFIVGGIMLSFVPIARGQAEADAEAKANAAQ